MERNAINLQRTIFGGSVAVLMVISSSAVATSEDTADLEVKATLSPSITVECNQALEFGTFVVPAGSRDAVAKIDFSPSGGVNSQSGVGGNTEVSHISDFTAGECKITGGPDGTEHEVQFFDGTNEVGTDDGTAGLPGTAFTLGSSGTNSANNAAAVEVTPTLATTAQSFSRGGSNTFKIGGQISIPNDLTTDNYGDYQKTIEVKLTTDP